MSTTHYTARLVYHHKTVRRIHSDNYSSLLALVVCTLESRYPTGIGLIRDNLQGSVIQRIKCTAIVD